MEIITASMAASGNKKGKKKMRLWHKDLISVLPDKQLLGQWRECCCIARNIAVNGSPNHLLVNKIMEYPISHLWKYGYLIMCEMEERGYDCDFDKFEKWFDKPWSFITPDYDELFADWHDKRYLRQCFFNLQEKCDCDGMSYFEYEKILILMIKKGLI